MGFSILSVDKKNNGCRCNEILLQGYGREYITYYVEVIIFLEGKMPVTTFVYLFEKLWADLLRDEVSAGHVPPSNTLAGVLAFQGVKPNRKGSWGFRCAIPIIRSRFQTNVLMEERADRVLVEIR